MDSMMQDGMMGGGMMLWGFLGFLLFLGLVVAIVLTIVWMVRRSSWTPDEPANSAEPPLESLQRRLAQDEIAP